MKHIFLFLCLLLVSSAQSQGDIRKGDPAAMTASTIKADEIKEYLDVLAADDMKGRETGEPGNQKAAQYIASKFAEWGIASPSGTSNHFQDVAFTKVSIGQTALEVNGGTFRNMKDFVIIPTSMSAEEVSFNTDEVIFMGYGIEDSTYNDYAKAKDLTGKTIMIYSGEPIGADGISQVTGTEKLSRWTFSLDDKLRVAKEHGVEGVVFISANFSRLVNSQRRFLLNGRTIMGKAEVKADQAPHMIISSTLAETMMGNKSAKIIKSRDKAAAKGKFKPVRFDCQINGTFSRKAVSTPGQNVVAYIEGTDPELKDELIVVTAHYDHVGYRGDDIYNGADDNASGTSGVMEIAQAFQEAKTRDFGPRRSVLCMLVTGEEKGLLGSQYYTEHPLFPLENTVANINMDMIGRLDSKHENTNYTYVIGSDRLSTELHSINEEVNKNYTRLELDYTYNAKDDPNQFYYRSDHYNFAKNGIPAIFFFSGTHPDYHKPTDTADKINFEKAEGIARLAFHTAWELANRDERIVVDVEQD